MTAFNPAVPNPNDNTPKWGRDSQPVTQFQGDKSMESLFSGIGETAANVVKFADMAVKTGIDDEVYKKVDAERTAFTESLESVAQVTNPTRKEILNTDDVKGPVGLEKHLGYVESLKNGAEAGRFNDTYYKSKLISVAKDLRTTYPGYREYIDKKISSITGFDPANSIIQDLLADINTLAGNKAKDVVKDKFNSLVDDYIKEGTVGSSELMGKVNRGEITAEQGMKQLEVWAKPKYDLAVAKRDLELSTSADGMAKAKGTKYFDQFMAKDVGNTINYLETEAGIASVPQIKEYINKVRRGELKNDPEKTKAFADILDQHISQMELKFTDHANSYQPIKGTSLTGLLGQEDVNKRVQAAIAPMRTLLGDLRSDNPTLAAFTKEAVNAKKDVATNRLLEDPKVSGFLFNSAAMEAVGGQTMAQKIGEMHSLADNLGPIKEYFAASSKAAAAQVVTPSPYGPITFKENINAPVAAAKVPAANTAAQALKNAQFMVDPEVKDDVKAGYATYFFHPNNVGTIAGFNKESGMKIWNTLTSPGFTQEAVKATRNYPEVAAWHKNWIEQTFGTEIFGRDVKDFSTLQLPVGVSLTYKSDAGQNQFRLIVNGKDITDKELMIGGTTGANIGQTTSTGQVIVDPQTRNAATVMRRVNTGIQGLANYYKATGKKPEEIDAFVMDNLTQSGYSPIGGAPTSFPEHMVKSMYISRFGGDIAKKLREGR